jgi:hypothetical protein
MTPRHRLNPQAWRESRRALALVEGGTLRINTGRSEAEDDHLGASVRHMSFPHAPECEASHPGGFPLPQARVSIKQFTCKRISEPGDALPEQPMPAPEATARQHIDRALTESGWAVLDISQRARKQGRSWLFGSKVLFALLLA